MIYFLGNLSWIPDITNMQEVIWFKWNLLWKEKSEGFKFIDYLDKACSWWTANVQMEF